MLTGVNSAYGVRSDAIKYDCPLTNAVVAIFVELSARAIDWVIVGVVTFVKLVIPLQIIFVDEIFVFVVLLPMVILFAFPVRTTTPVLVDDRVDNVRVVKYDAGLFVIALILNVLPNCPIVEPDAFAVPFIINCDPLVALIVVLYKLFATVALV